MDLVRVCTIYIKNNEITMAIESKSERHNPNVSLF